MSDAIIKFPSPIKANEDQNDTAASLEKIFSQAPPANGTEVYQTMQVYSVPKKIKTKTDFTSATERNPHWGVMLSFSLIPGLSQAPVGPLMLPSSPGQFITGDTLKEIRERIIFELDKAIQIAELAEKNPEEYNRYERALLQRIASNGEDES